jgi:hypothetical protein
VIPEKGPNVKCLATGEWTNFRKNRYRNPEKIIRVFRWNDPQGEAVDSLVVEEDICTGIESLGVEPAEKAEASYDDEASTEMLHRGCIHR